MKNLIDIISALPSPITAIIVTYVAWQQWRTSRNALKLELFDKRFQIFEKITGFIATILISGKVEYKDTTQFLRDTKSAKFLFNDDVKITDLIDEICKKANDLEDLQTELQSINGDVRKENVANQREIKNWYEKKLRDIDEVFKKYLILTH